LTSSPAGSAGAFNVSTGCTNSATTSLISNCSARVAGTAIDSYRVIFIKDRTLQEQIINRYHQ
jgi:hypothetical protein